MKVFLAAFLLLHVSRKKRLEALSYKKYVRKMLMKLTTGVLISTRIRKLITIFFPLIFPGKMTLICVGKT